MNIITWEENLVPLLSDWIQLPLCMLEVVIEYTQGSRADCYARLLVTQLDNMEKVSKWIECLQNGTLTSGFLMEICAGTPLVVEINVMPPNLYQRLWTMKKVPVNNPLLCFSPALFKQDTKEESKSGKAHFYLDYYGPRNVTGKRTLAQIYSTMFPDANLKKSQEQICQWMLAHKFDYVCWKFLSDIHPMIHMGVPYLAA